MIVAEETRREEMNKAVLANLSQHVVDLLKDECPCTVRGALEESRGVVLCCVAFLVSSIVSCSCEFRKQTPEEF